MTTFAERHQDHDTVLPWIAALVITAFLSFGLGTSFELPQSEPAATSSDQSLPDWHGNVKRSQGGEPSERFGG